MLVFHGGFTLEQVKKLKNNDYYIYEKIPYEFAYANRENTFDYIPKELYGKELEEQQKYVSENEYINQYIFLARSLEASLDYCSNSRKRNYVVIFDIEEEILNQYIGVGKYERYRIEYKLPRKFIMPENIIDVLFFEPYDTEQMDEFERKYQNYYWIKLDEDENARKLILEKNLQFNTSKKYTK